jgi:hypothetical protein
MTYRTAMLHKKSHLAFDRAKQLMPGGVNTPARAFGGVGGEPIFFDRTAGLFATRHELRRAHLGLEKRPTAGRRTRCCGCPMPLRVIFGSGVAVCPIARPLATFVQHSLAGQDPRGVFRRHQRGSPLVVGGMGFCNTRPKRYLYKTTATFTKTITLCPRSGRLAA